MKCKKTTGKRSWMASSGFVSLCLTASFCAPVSLAAHSPSISADAWQQQGIHDTTHLVTAGAVKPGSLSQGRALLVAMLGRQVESLAQGTSRDLDRRQRRMRLRDSIRQDIDGDLQQRAPDRDQPVNSQPIAQATVEEETRLSTSAGRAATESISAEPLSRLLDRTVAPRLTPSARASKNLMLDGVSTADPQVNRPRRRHGRLGIRPGQVDQNNSVIDEIPITGVDNAAQVTERLPGDRPVPNLRNAPNGTATRSPTRRTTGR
jgi:hypothetical protein